MHDPTVLPVTSADYDRSITSLVAAFISDLLLR